MPDNNDKYKENIQDEIDDFLEHREQIKHIVGQIGGKPKMSIKIVNTIFFALLILSFLLPLTIKSIPHIFMLDFGVLLISIKIIYSLTRQAKVNHYQFWILATLEWRLHDIDSSLKELKKTLKKHEG